MSSKFCLHKYNTQLEGELEWCISGMLRQYTLRNMKIISKTGACQYGIQHMPERWHNLIQEVINIREGSSIRYYDSKQRRIHDTVECMHYILNYCNNMYRN